MVKLQPMEEYSHPAALSGSFADVSASTIAEFREVRSTGWDLISTTCKMSTLDETKPCFFWGVLLQWSFHLIQIFYGTLPFFNSLQPYSWRISRWDAWGLFPWELSGRMPNFMNLMI